MPHLYSLAMYKMKIFLGVTKYIFFGGCKAAWHGSFLRMDGLWTEKEGRQERQDLELGNSSGVSEVMLFESLPCLKAL